MTWKKILGYLMSPLLWVSIAVIVVLTFVYRMLNRPSTFSGVPNAKFRLTHPVAVYKAVANRLYAAMTGPGTDEQAMFDDLSDLNKDELIQVYNDFGHRINGNGGFPFDNNEPKDLIAFFKEELSGGDLSKMKAIWSPTNIWT